MQRKRKAKFRFPDHYLLHTCTAQLSRLTCTSQFLKENDQCTNVPEYYVFDLSNVYFFFFFLLAQ